jgi:NADH-quinone oxidoreductase subunit L
MNQLLYSLLLLPLIGFILNGTLGKFLPKIISGILGSATIFGSFVIGILYFQQLQLDSTPIETNLINWLSIDKLSISFGILLDRLSVLWILFITGIGFLIHVYSISYMKEDEGFARFFAYLNLFVFFMLVLVLGNNLLVTFIGWEGVGLCSYLLIGFWYKNNEYNQAANKAFIMNRIGDLGFLVATFLLFYSFGSLDYSSLSQLIKTTPTEHWMMFSITMALFIAATGKSAQLPLYTWLPDAMAGPTPVSALIHAATMVTAGIYLICRLYFLFDCAPETLHIIAVIGASTALFSATIALLQNDIKKILAYSTVSQLGLMFLALGLGAYTSGIFHVITHAFFKACLFLGAGSVIHALHHQQDIRQMGGLKSKLPLTFLTFLVATLAISGIPPFAGFFSKDEILAQAFEYNKILWIIASLTSILTAFYMFRLLFLVFYTSHRGTTEQWEHAHESPKAMTIPLLVLGFLSLIGGFLGLPHFMGGHHGLNEFLAPVFIDQVKQNTHLEVSTEWLLVSLAVFGAIVGIYFAHFMYNKKNQLPKNTVKELSIPEKLIYHKYFIDEIYHYLIVQPTKAFSWIFQNLTEKILDFSTKIATHLLTFIGKILNQFQTGNMGHYILFIVLGVCVFLYYIILM